MLLINQNDYEDKIYITKTNKPDWQNGLKTTIKSSGCGICCGIMVANYFGYDLSMDDAIKLSYDYKANTSSGTKYKEYANGLADKFDLYIERSDDPKYLFDFLDNGGCAVVNVGGDNEGHLGYFSHMGHYIFIEGHNNNELRILDPGVDENKYKEEHRKDIKFDGNYVYADIKFLLDDIKNREYPFFLFKKNRVINSYQDIFVEIDRLNDDFINIWKQVVEIQSPSSYKQGVDEVQQFFLKYAASQLWTCEQLQLEKSGNCLCIDSKQYPNETICLSGHMDTVHPINSIKTEIKGDKIYGPGVTDCKGGLIECLLVMKALKNLGFTKRNIRFLLQSDEEVGSRTSNKQSIKWIIEKAKDCICFLNTEMSTKDTLVLQRKGICNYEIECFGVSCHSGICYEGSNAIKQASHIVIELEKFQEEDGITINCGRIEGGSVSNVVADYCKIIVDVRYNKKVDLDYIDKYIENICNKEYVKGCSSKYKLISTRVPMEENDTNKELLNKINTIMKKCNMPQFISRKTNGGSDASDISQANIPVVDSIGVQGGLIHNKGEFAYIDSLADMAKKIGTIIYEI